jgi:hypothetical protein
LRPALLAVRAVLPDAYLGISTGAGVLIKNRNDVVCEARISRFIAVA